MCSLILITSIAWYVVKPDIVNAYDVSGFYGAGNCKCADLSDCPDVCNSAQWIVSCEQSHSSDHNCEGPYSNYKPCGRSPSSCKDYPGGSYNCAIMDG